MTTLAMVSVVTMLGWLALMIANYNSYNVPHGKTLRLIAAWVAIFAVIALIFRALGFA